MHQINCYYYQPEADNDRIIKELIGSVKFKNTEDQSLEDLNKTAWYKNNMFDFVEVDEIELDEVKLDKIELDEISIPKTFIEALNYIDAE